MAHNVLTGFCKLMRGSLNTIELAALYTPSGSMSVKARYKLGENDRNTGCGWYRHQERR